MTLAEKIRAERGTGSLTYPQGKLLYQLTKLKWWQPETMPPPTVKQASLLIDATINFVKTHEGGAELVEAIQIWFPTFDDLKEVHSRFFPKGHPSHEHEQPESTPDSTSKGGPACPPPEHAPKRTKARKPETVKRSHHAKRSASVPEPPEHNEAIPKPEPKSAPKPTPKPTPEKPVKGIEDLEALIHAGIINIWMVGPAGCGKTTICQEVGKKSDVPVTVIPCGAGTSATAFLGYKYPEREGTPFVLAFAQEGIIVLDEFTALEAQVAQIVNGALANNELTSTVGTFHRHEKCVIIATSNTFGNGADRMYVSNNQLDASTIDRFAGGILEIDYSREYESQYDPEVARYVWTMRDIIKKNGFRRVASTRSIIVGCKLKTAGVNWKNALIANWSKDEKALL